MAQANPKETPEKPQENACFEAETPRKPQKTPKRGFLKGYSKPQKNPKTLKSLYQRSAEAKVGFWGFFREIFFSLQTLIIL